MWENYPEALRGWARRDWKYLVFKNYKLARAVEKWVTKRVDHIFTVVEEARERLIADGVNPSRVSVVTNGVDLDVLKTSASVGVSFDPDPDAYKLFYVGDITVERGLDDILRALRLARNAVPRVHLYIAGTGKDLPRLKTIAATEGVSDLVTFLGFLPFDQIHSYVMKSDLCLVPHVHNDFINTTIPNKLFQYMVLRKPVLVSNAKPLARIVGQCGCGFIFKSGSREDAAAKIIAAHHAQDDDSYGGRGKVCAEQYYLGSRFPRVAARLSWSHSRRCSRWVIKRSLQRPGILRFGKFRLSGTKSSTVCVFGTGIAVEFRRGHWGEWSFTGSFPKNAGFRVPHSEGL